MTCPICRCDIKHIKENGQVYKIFKVEIIKNIIQNNNHNHTHNYFEMISVPKMYYIFLKYITILLFSYLMISLYILIVEY